MARLNDALLAQTAEAKLVRMHKVRTDTTVVEVGVAYPTDSGLLAKAVTCIAATLNGTALRKVRCCPSSR